MATCRFPFRKSRNPICVILATNLTYLISVTVRGQFLVLMSHDDNTRKATNGAVYVSLMDHMLMRLALFVTAILTISFARIVVDAEARHAADDCLAGPNVTAPQGSHWYYHVDHTTHRECWYLGPEGKEVRTRANQSRSSVRSYPSNEKSQQPASQTSAPDAATAKAEGAETTPAEAVPIEITFGEAKAPGDNATQRAIVATSTASVDPRSVLNGGRYEGSILDPAESPASGEPASELPISLAQLGAVFAVVLGLSAIIGRMIVKPFAVCKRARGRRRPQHRRGKMPSRNANIAAEGHCRRDKASTPLGDRPVDFEASVRRLLHELHQRQHEPERRASNLVAARLDTPTSDVLLKAAEAIERLKRWHTGFGEIAMRNGN